MGMYSNFADEDVEVKDLEGLKGFLERWKEYLFSQYNKGERGNKDTWKENYYNIIDDKDRISFDKWDNIKLISYWYSNQVIFLTCVAKYIEGTVQWDFESDDEAGSIEFVDGKCKFHTGVMTWTEWDYTNLNKEELKGELKDLLLLEKI